VYDDLTWLSCIVTHPGFNNASPFDARLGAFSADAFLFFQSVAQRCPKVNLRAGLMKNRSGGVSAMIPFLFPAVSVRECQTRNRAQDCAMNCRQYLTRYSSLQR